MASRVALLALVGEASALVQKNIGSTDEVSPTMIAVVVGAVVCILLAIFVISKSRGQSYKAFGDKSGLSTSSSDITSSETGSTDRELKSRMERFEKRLEEHKKMLETRDPEVGSSSVTESDSKFGSSTDQSAGRWFNKK